MVSYSRTVSPIFTLTKYVGLFPYRLRTGRLPKGKRTLSLMVNFIAIGFGLLTMYKDWSKKIWMTMDLFKFLRRVLGRLWFILAVATHIFWQIRQPQKMERILMKLHSITSFIGSQHFTRYNIGIAIFGLLAYGFVLPSVVVARGAPISDVIGGLIIPYVHNVLFLAQFFTFMEVIHCNFLKLNQITLFATDLETCTGIHAELCDITKEVNEVYNMELVMSFVSWLASLITQWFQIHETIIKGEPHAAFIITPLPWIFVFQCVQMWSLCYISYEVHYQSDCFSDSLCWGMRKKYPPSYSKKLILYLARRPSAKVTGFSLFNIDTGILATILGTTMTYFIVLVQLY